MLIENIVYSDDFNAFLDSLCDDNKVSIIKESLNDFAKGRLDLDPKDCQHYKERIKVLIDAADVVVYYDLKDNDMIMIGGSPMKKRAA